MAGGKDKNAELTLDSGIQGKIHTIRGVQVMLDMDLALLYGTETKVLNRAVKRNGERFPEEFMFKLTEQENMRFQNGTSNVHGGRRYLPYAFTEQGVAMLSAVLRSDTAVRTSIQIINAFVAMRHFIASNALLFQRLDALEVKQFETDRKMEHVLNALESGEVRPKQGIFFDGQVFDAHKFVSDLFRSAEKSITIIDNYLDDTVLAHLAKRKRDVSVTLLTRNLSEALVLDVERFNRQYPKIAVRKFDTSHDRFIIIDDATIYHFGASLKDLGKKWFAFSKMDIGAADMLARLR